VPGEGAASLTARCSASVQALHLLHEVERGARFLLVEEDEDNQSVVRGVTGQVHLADFMHLAGSVEELGFAHKKLRQQIDFLTLLVEALSADLGQHVEFLTLLVDALHADLREGTP
jgi:hypothetical protein